MKKIILLLFALSSLTFANVLIEDFEEDDRVSLLSDKDVWFVYSDSADVGCYTEFDYDEEKNVERPYHGPCSVFNTIYIDGLFSDWSFEPRKLIVKGEDGEYKDTTMYFPLRTTSPFTAADRQKEGPAVTSLKVNETHVGGLYYEFGESQLMMRPTPYGYDIAEPDYWFVPYVAIGLKMTGNGTDYDLSKCKGITYTYRGEGHRFRADMSTVYDNNYHATKVNPSYALSNSGYGGATRTVQGYSVATIYWSQLTQENWGTKKAFDAKRVKQLVWELKGGNLDQNPYGSTTTTNLFDKKIPNISSDIGTLVIDDVACITTETSIPVGSTPSPTSSSGNSGTGAGSTNSPTSGNSGADAILTHASTPNITTQALATGLFVSVPTASKVMFFDHQGRLIQSSSELSAGSNFVPYGKLAKGSYIAVIKAGSVSRSMQITVK